MRLISKYSLFVAAPLALASSGCMSGTSWMIGRFHHDPAAQQQRLAQAAQLYEAQGQYQAAYQAYNRLAMVQPENQLARQKMQEVAQKAQAGANGAQPPNATPSAEQALRMLAEIQTKHRQEVAARRERTQRNPDALLASIQRQMDEYKAQQSRLNQELAGSANTDSPARSDIQRTRTVTAQSAARGVATAELDEFGNEFWADATQVPLTANGKKVTTPALVLDLAKPEEQLPQVQPARSAEWQARSVARLCEEVPAGLEHCVALLDSRDTNEQIEGLSILSEAGPQAKPMSLAVRSLLKHPNSSVRAHAADTLFSIEQDTWDAVHTLTALLVDSDPAVVQLSCYILGQIGPAAKASLPQLETALTAQSGVTALHAAEALIRIDSNHQGAFDALNAALDNEERSMRWFAAVALGSVKGAHATPAVAALQASLHDVEADVRAAAALSLGGLGASAEPAISQLEQVALFDEDEVRHAASTALLCLKR